MDDPLTLSQFEDNSLNFDEDEELNIMGELQTLLEKSRGTRHEQNMIQLVKDHVFQAEQQRYDDALALQGDSGVLAGFDQTLLDIFTEREGGRRAPLTHAERQERRMAGLAVPTHHRTWKAPATSPRDIYSMTNRWQDQRPGSRTGKARGGGSINSNASSPNCGSRASPPAQSASAKSSRFKVDQTRFDEWIDRKYSQYNASKARIAEKKARAEESLTASRSPVIDRRSVRLAERVQRRVDRSDAGLLTSVRELKDNERQQYEKAAYLAAKRVGHMHLTSKIAFGNHISRWERETEESASKHSHMRAPRSRSLSPGKKKKQPMHNNNQSNAFNAINPDAATEHLDVFSRMYKYKDIYKEKKAALATSPPSSVRRPRPCPGSAKILEEKGLLFREQGKYVVPQKTLEDYIKELGLEDEAAADRAKSAKAFSTRSKYSTISKDGVVGLKKEPSFDWSVPLNATFEGSRGTGRGLAFGPTKEPAPNSLRASVAKKMQSKSASSSSSFSQRRSSSSSGGGGDGDARGRSRMSDQDFRPLLISSRRTRDATVRARGNFEERVNKEVDKYITKNDVAKRATFTPGPGTYDIEINIGKKERCSLPSYRTRSASPSRAGITPHYDGSLRSSSPGRAGYSWSREDRGLCNV